jgi:pimeloyl-ACP methyl ester carboxylesterase
MLVCVGDINLFVEVVGTRLDATAQEVVERPTVIMLHGGPNWDHMTLLPGFSPLADVAQLVFYDHRGLGRSGVSSQEHWTLRQWALDLKRLLDQLGIVKPILLGQSFGGFVAQEFATTWPDDYAALILSSTAARFDLEEAVASFTTIGGGEIGRLARAYYTAPTKEEGERFRRETMLHYTVNRMPIGTLSRDKPDVRDHFFSEAGDAHRIDYRASLGRLTAPTLVIGGEEDPVTTARACRELGASFAQGVAETIVLERCGHGPTRDRPEVALPILRDFIRRIPAAH